MESYALRCAEWLVNRVRNAEARDPHLRPLKDQINELSERIKSANEEEIPNLLREQDLSIQSLISHISQRARSPNAL